MHMLHDLERPQKVRRKKDPISQFRRDLVARYIREGRRYAQMSDLYTQSAGRLIVSSVRFLAEMIPGICAEPFTIQTRSEAATAARFWAARLLQMSRVPEYFTCLGEDYEVDVRMRYAARAFLESVPGALLKAGEVRK